MRVSGMTTALAISTLACAASAPAQQAKRAPIQVPPPAPSPAEGGAVKAGVDAWSRGDYKAAVERWRGPAVAGDADAQFNLGQAYKLGRGVPTDPGMAESWFRKAAMQGHVQAEDNYGLALFQSGRQSESVPWLEKSVARGEPRARLVLGTMLFNGDGGVRRDYPRAYALMTLASRAGLQSASATLAQMDQYISPADRQRGTELAAQLTAQDRAAAVAAPPARPEPSRPEPSRPLPTPPRSASTPPPRTGPIRTTPLPPSHAAETAPPRTAPKPAAKPAAAAAAGWRIQLGAFRDRGNAEALWRSVGPRTGASPVYAASGGVTRLQAGPFASKAAAQKACSAVRVTCVVVAP